MNTEIKIHDGVFDKKWVDDLAFHLSTNVSYIADNIAGRKSWPYGHTGTHRLMGRFFYKYNDWKDVTIYQKECFTDLAKAIEYLNPNLDEFPMSSGSAVWTTSLANTINGFDVDNGEIGTPQTTVLTKNDLGDPDHIPIDLGGLSELGYDYLKNKANEEFLAGTYDLMKRGQVPFLTPDQVNKILVDPKFQKLLQDDPDILPILQRMRASNPTPFAGAQDGDQFAFFGGNKNKNTPPPAPTKRTRKGTMDATKASTGMYPSMTPEIFLQKYGISYNEYLALP